MLLVNYLRKRHASSVLSILLLPLLLCACISQPTMPLRADLGKNEVEESIQLAEILQPKIATLPKENEAWFEVLRGTQPVILTAPHATKPMRNGTLRFSDGVGTATLAVALHKLTGATVVYTTLASPSDPNYYDDNEFKRSLAQLIKEIKPRLVLDIHGSHANRPFEIDFGTMNGRSLKGKEALIKDLIRHLREEGIMNLSKDYFTAGKSQTITRWSVEHGVPAIQLEISTTWLRPEKDDLHAHRYAQLLQALTRYLRELVE